MYKCLANLSVYATSAVGLMGGWQNSKCRVAEIGYNCKKCIVFSPDEMRLYRIMFQYLNIRGVIVQSAKLMGISGP